MLVSTASLDPVVFGATKAVVAAALCTGTDPATPPATLVATETGVVPSAVVTWPEVMPVRFAMLKTGAAVNPGAAALPVKLPNSVYAPAVAAPVPPWGTLSGVVNPESEAMSEFAPLCAGA